MIRHVFRVFGIPIFTLDVTQYEIVEDESDTARIEGGSAHNFERDFNPLSPDDRYDWEWEDKKGFGFR